MYFPKEWTSDDIARWHKQRAREHSIWNEIIHRMLAKYGSFASYESAGSANRVFIYDVSEMRELERLARIGGGK